MRRRSRAVAVGVGLAVLAVGMGRGAQLVKAAGREAAYHAQASESAAPTIQVYSRETVVDVTVLDKDGKPMRGLTRADFSVTEDDKQQAIRSFKEFDSATPADLSAPRNLPPNTYTNVQMGTGPLYVLLFDGINGGGGRSAAAKFIKNLAPGTRVALLAMGGRFTVMRGPTTDPNLLLKGVNAYVMPGGGGPCPYKEWATLDQLNEVATYLSEIKGKKNLIWIGKGIPNMIFPELGCQDWRLPLQQTYDLLEDAQVTVYPVDPSGVQAPPAPKLVEPSSLSGAQANPSEPPPSYSDQAVKQNADWLSGVATNHLALEAVAEATGGQAFYNTNDIAGAIAKAEDAGASYYTLSYAPPSVEYDGRYHAIGVKVDRPGVHLLYRQGYSDEDPALIEHPPETLFGVVTRDTRPTGAAADPFVAAMSPTGPSATQLLFDVRVEPSTEPVKPTGKPDPKLKNAALTRYGFVYTVLPEQFAFRDGPDGVYRGSLEFVVVAFDASGRQVTMLDQTVGMPLSVDGYADFVQRPFQFVQQIDLPPGQMHVRVGVRDKVSNKVGTVEVPVTVAKGSGVVAER